MISSYLLPLYKNVTFLLILKKTTGFLALFWVSLFSGFFFTTQAQNPLSPKSKLITDTSRVQIANLDTSRRDTAKLVNKDSLKVKHDIETTIKYNAKDSIVYDLSSKMIYMYGNASVNYGKTQLDAERVEIDQKNNLIFAKGIPDSTGKSIGAPVMKDGTQNFEAKAIQFNIKSGKGLITEVVTKQGDGFVLGDKVKKDNDGNLYIGNARYTTCNLAEPHFYIKARKIKMVANKQIVAGPFNFHLADIPTPLGFFFGIFPIMNTDKAKSGIIFPTYGEEPTGRGFYLKNGGYYWAVNENVTMAFIGEIYSKGGWGLSSNGLYKKKYQYDGNFSVRFNRRLQGDEGSRYPVDDFWISWSHAPQSKGTGRFSASVNAGSNGFNSRNSTLVANRVSTSFNSSVSYSKTFANNLITFSSSIRHDMNVSTRVMTMTLPDVSLNVTRIYPLNFVNVRSSGSKWWKTLNIGYQFRGSQQLTNITSASSSSFSFPIYNPVTAQKTENQTKSDTLSFLRDFTTVLKRGQIGGVHTIPIGISLKLLRYFNLNPSFNYSETWYSRRLDYKSVADANGRYLGVEVDTLNKFSRFYSYSMSAGLSTRIFGTYTVHGKRIEAIRHTMIPSISLGYSPDLSKEKYGFYQKVQINGAIANNQMAYNLLKYGDSQIISRYQGFFLGGPGSGSSGSISFSLNNTLEAKVRAKADTSQKNNDTKKQKFEKRSLLDNFGISSSYNLLADKSKGQFALSNISLNATTRLANNKLNVNITGTIDPYKIVLDSIGSTGTVYQRRIPELVWQHADYTGTKTYRNVGTRNTGGIGQLANANLSLSTSLGPKSKSNPVKPVAGKVTEEQAKEINNNPDRYVDFKIPWQLNVSYTMSYRKDGFQPSAITSNVNFNGNISLTEKWKVTFSSGYDITNHLIAVTNFGINRNLHCWTMAINWIPFGKWTSYDFTIRANSALLQDLKLTKQRSWYDR